MTPDVLERSLLLHGTDFSRWPPAEAAAAQRLIASNSTARMLYDDIARLDGTLKQAAAPEPTDSALTGRILEATQSLDAKQARLRAPVFPPTWRLAATSLAAAASIAGFAVGYLGEDGPLPLDDAEIMALGATDGENAITDMWLLL